MQLHAWALGAGLAVGLTGCGASRYFTDLEVATHDGINAHRAELGLPALQLHVAVGRPAREHSQDMASNVVPFSHEGFEVRADTIRVGLPEVQSVGENVATNKGFEDPVEVAIQGWLDSPGHRENIEGDWAFSGVGIAQSDDGSWYLTQMFAR